MQFAGVQKVVLKGAGKVYFPKTGGPYIYIPAMVGKDSQFPFEHGEEIFVEVIDQETVVLRKKNSKGREKTQPP